MAGRQRVAIIGTPTPGSVSAMIAAVERARTEMGITCDLCDGTDHETDFCPNVDED